MPLDLPDPDRRPLERAQLPLVVCQIKSEPLPLATDPRVAIAIHEGLGGRNGRFPRTEPIQNFTITAGVAGAPVTSTTGWRFASEDRDWGVVIQPDQVSLETSAYATWDDFRDRLFELIDAVTQHLGPASVLRTGLRYVNRLGDPEVASPAEWDGLLVPELLGLALHDRLGVGILAAQGQVDFDTGDDVKTALRHGFYRDEQEGGRLTYVLDFDSYQDGFRPWDSQALKDTANGLNDVTLQLFQQVVTERLLAYLRGEDDDGGNT